MQSHGGHDHDHDHAHGSDEDWGDEAFVAGWLERQAERATDRRRQFAIVRAVIPRLPDEEFRYLNLGAGPGNLDEVLLEHFEGATATLVDFSLPLLAAARQRLERFGDRVELVHGNLATSDWVGGVGGSFDYVVSTLALHHLREPRRVRELYAEVYRLLGHGGAFFNLDHVRAARPALAPLAAWATWDPEAGFTGRRHGDDDLPGTALEHLGWLGEAGFGLADVLWKDPSSALLCGVRDHLHVPDDAHSDGHAAGHAHSH